MSPWESVAPLMLQQEPQLLAEWRHRLWDPIPPPGLRSLTWGFLSLCQQNSYRRLEKLHCAGWRRMSPFPKETSSLLVSCTGYSSGCFIPLLLCWVRLGPKALYIWWPVKLLKCRHAYATVTLCDVTTPHIAVTQGQPNPVAPSASDSSSTHC